MGYKIIEKENEYFLNISSSKNLKKQKKNYKRKSFWCLKNLNLKLKICFLKKKIKSNNDLIKLQHY